MDAYSLLTFSLALLLLPSFSVLAANSKASRHPKVLLISYDGFRYSYLGEHGPTPTFDSLIRNGVFVPEVKNVFPTKTFPNHISLVTGLYPGVHGGLSNTIYDRGEEKVVDMFKDGEPYVTKNPGVLPLWVVNEMAGDGRYSGVSMWPGEPFRFGPNKSHATHVLTYNHDMPWEDRVDVALDWFVNETAPANFVAFYIEEPDKSGHDFGPDGPEVDEVVRKLDNLTSYIKTGLEKRGLWDEVNLIVTADHGMSPVTGTNILNITEYVNSSTVAVASNSPLLFYYALPGFGEKVEQQLQEAAKELKFDLYKAGEWPDKWFLGSTDALPDYMAIAPVNHSFQEAFWLEPWNNRSHNLTYGVHGFDNDMPDMHPMLIGHGPSFKVGFELPDLVPGKGDVDAEMMSLDLYPLICDILGVPAPPNNGTLSRATPLLRVVPPTPPGHASNILLPALLIFFVLASCAFVGFLVWRRRQGYGLQGPGTSGRTDSSDRPGARSEEEQHLLVPPQFLNTTEEV